ncbi:hypothetical protein BDFB_015025, partial [Asbolus verrucosus]
SKDAYEKEFEEFNAWREKRGVTLITENVLLAYFFNVKKRFAASSMWTKYSMLNPLLKVHKNIDILIYVKLRYRGAKVLEREYIEQFLKGAPDEEYLMKK